MMPGHGMCYRTTTYLRKRKNCHPRITLLATRPSFASINFSYLTLVDLCQLVKMPSITTYRPWGSAPNEPLRRWHSGGEFLFGDISASSVNDSHYCWWQLPNYTIFASTMVAKSPIPDCLRTAWMTWVQSYAPDAEMQMDQSVTQCTRRKRLTERLMASGIPRPGFSR